MNSLKLDNNKADAIIVNTKSCGNHGKILWDTINKNALFQKFNFQNAKKLNLSDFNHDQIQSVVNNWIGECINLGYKKFVAVGGDGTVHLAMNALIQHKNSSPILGAIGIGSSNDFHKKFCNNESNKISDIPIRLNFQKAFYHDICEVNYESENNELNKEYFIINSSIGFTAEANLLFNKNNFLKLLKKYSTNLSIFTAIIKVLFVFKKLNLDMIIDNNSNKNMEIINLGISKNTNFAGDFKYLSSIKEDDGKLDINYFTIEKNKKHKSPLKYQILKILFNLINRSYKKNLNFNSNICSKIKVTSQNPFAIEMDGEVKTALQAEFNILPKELLVCP